jgi:hypothetical protein
MSLSMPPSAQHGMEAMGLSEFDNAVHFFSSLSFLLNIFLIIS